MSQQSCLCLVRAVFISTYPAGPAPMMSLSCWRWVLVGCVTYRGQRALASTHTSTWDSGVVAADIVPGCDVRRGK